MSDLRLRPAGPADLDFIVAAESHPENRRFISAWPRSRHEAGLDDPDLAQLVLEEADTGRAVGYVLLAGLADPHGAVEFRRIVVVDKGRGHGRRAVRLVKRFAFRKRGTHRLWLDVVETNDRARRLYESEGFILEGRLRDAHWTGDGYASLDVFSLLEHEYGGDEPGGDRG